jgi:hypothetical protein
LERDQLDEQRAKDNELFQAIFDDADLRTLGIDVP